MELTYQGINFEITEAIEKHIKDKFSPMVKFNSKLTSANVKIQKSNKDNGAFQADITVFSPLGDLHQAVEHTDAYSALTDLSEKIIRQVRKQKEKHK